jgi:capsular exopolysaccharide synthesis family protein
VDTLAGAESDIHLWDYVRTVIQRWPVALTAFLTAMTLSVAYTWTRTPRYTATARMLIEQNQINLTGLKDAYDPVLGAIGKREFMETQAKLMTSRPILETVLKNPALDLRSLRGSSNPVGALSGLITVTPVRNTFLIDVSVTAEDPREAALLVNTLISAYLEDNRRRRLGVSEEGLSELRKTAESLRAKLDTATRELHDFMRESRVVSFEKTQNIILERLRELGAQLAAAEPRRMALQARLETAEAALAAGQTADSIPNVLESPIVKQLKLDLASQEREHSLLTQRLGANHPQLQASVTQMDSIRVKLAMEANNVLKGLHTEFDQAKKEEALLRQALKDHEAEVFRFNEIASRYEVLNQTKNSTEKTYETIIRRIEEIDINRLTGQGENVFVISRASIPTQKSWPNKTKNLAVALVLACGLAVALSFFLDYMDTTIKNEQDVKNLLRAPILGSIPDIQLEVSEGVNADLVVQQKPRSHVAEAFRSLRTAMAFSVSGAVRSLVVSSTFPSEGKTLVSCNLAITQAQIGRRTLLVDADMRKPRIHKTFGLTDKKGLSNLLADPANTSLMEVVLPTSVPNLFFLPAGPIPGNPVELLDSEEFGRFLAHTRTQFDLVVLDSPPGFSLVDSIVMAKRTSGLLLVIRSFVTPKVPTQQLVGRMHMAGVPLLGVALNNVDMPRAARYGYYHYRYGGYRYYSKYYRTTEA